MGLNMCLRNNEKFKKLITPQSVGTFFGRHMHVTRMNNQSLPGAFRWRIALMFKLAISRYEKVYCMKIPTLYMCLEPSFYRLFFEVVGLMAWILGYWEQYLGIFEAIISQYFGCRVTFLTKWLVPSFRGFSSLQLG
jgi:hypothetical protein